MAIWGNEAKAGALWKGFFFVLFCFFCFFCLSLLYFLSYFMMWALCSGMSMTHSDSSVGGREAQNEALIIATAKLLLYSGFLNNSKPLMQPGTQMFTMYALGSWRSLSEELRCAPTLTSSKGRQNLFSFFFLKADLNNCWPLEGSTHTYRHTACYTGFTVNTVTTDCLHVLLRWQSTGARAEMQFTLWV